MAGTTSRWFLQLRESFQRFRTKDASNLRQDAEKCRPLSLRTSFTVVTLAYTVALIAALEYCFHTLPVSEDRRDIPNGTESEIYGPFNWAPLARLVDTTETSSAPPLTITAWNSSAVITPAPTITEGAPSTSSSTSTDPFEDSPDGTVYFGNRPGILGFGLDHPIHGNATKGNSTKALSRRVPPPDKWGQLPGRMQLVQFDVTGRQPWPNDPHPGYVWAIIEYFYDSDENHPIYASMMKNRVYCPSVCDGPALVFLETRCWDQWKNKASMYRRDTARWPTAIHTNVENAWKEGTPCPTAIATTPILVEVPPPDVSVATTMSSRTVDAEIIEVTTVSGQPTTLTRTTQLVIPIVPDPVEDNPGPGPTRPRPAEVSAEPTDDGWTPTTTITQKDDQGRPTATVTARLRATETTMTLTDIAGRPTATLITNIPLISSVITFSGADGVVTTSTVLVPAYQIHGQERPSITLTNSAGVPVATVPISPDYGPRTKPRPGTHASDDAAIGSEGDSNFDFHPISWGDYLFASFAPILVTLPLAWLIQMQSGSLKALLPYFILSSSSSSSAGRNRSSSVGNANQDGAIPGGGGATAAESLCLITGGPWGIWNGVRLFFVGTSTTRRKEPLGFFADLHVVVLSAIVSLSSEALGIRLIGRCRVDDFRGCHMGLSLFLVPGRIVQALLAVSLALGVLNALVLLQRAEWKRAVDIYARHGNRGVEGTAELLEGSPEETQKYFRKVATSAAEDADTDGDGYISTKELAKHLDDHLFSIRVRSKPAMGCSTSISLNKTSTGEKKSEEHIPPAVTTSTYYLEVTPRDTTLKADSTKTWSSDVSDMKGEDKLSRSETMKSWLGPLNRISLTPARQDLLGQLAFLLAMIGLMILVMYYELTSDPDSPFERFMNSQGLGVRSLFTAMGVIVSLFWDNHYSEISTREPSRQLVISASSSTSSTTPSLKWNHVIILTATGAAVSKITPILLCNVPFSPWLTWLTHQVCTWSVVGILGFMIVVVFYTYIKASIAEGREPHMPVHPGTFGGRLFYAARYKGHSK
ncbi:hypothetical protein V8F06_014197 [Rhypophila decipiens]